MMWTWEPFYQGANVPLIVVIEGLPAQQFQMVFFVAMAAFWIVDVPLSQCCASSFNILGPNPHYNSVAYWAPTPTTTLLLTPSSVCLPYLLCQYFSTVYIEVAIVCRSFREPLM